MQLSFDVSGEYIKRLDSYRVIQNDTQLSAIFQFSGNEWKEKIITILFTKGTESYIILLNNNRCLIPDELLEDYGEFYVTVRTDDFITTNSACVIIHKNDIIPRPVPPKPGDKVLIDGGSIEDWGVII